MDWTRAGLKTQAKQYLKTRYWYALLVGFIAALLGAVEIGSGTPGLSGSNFSFNGGETSGMGGGALVVFVVVFVIVFTLIMVAALAYAFFVAGPVLVGHHRWFVNTRRGEPASKIGLIFSLFKKGDYRGSVAGTAWRYLWSFLWGLPYAVVAIPTMLLSGLLVFKTAIEVVEIVATRLGRPIDLSGLTSVQDFISSRLPSTAALLGLLAILTALCVAALIPVIWKSISYRMVPWILADNPRIGARRALDLSKAMTRGHGFEIFLLALSFLGWYLLARVTMILTCCLPLGPYALQPYLDATESELYAALKHDAVLRGDTTPEELGYAVAAAPAPALESVSAEEGTTA